MKIEKIKQANTQHLGKEILYYPKLESTQQEAKKIVENKIKNGTIILTNHQTRGQGTKQRVWYSTKNANITMTLILYPNCKIQQLEGITKKIAQAMQTAIKDLYQIDLEIKQPNDLLLHGKKIAGILTQTASCEDKVTYLLIGIGCNVNEINFAKEIQEIATSLKKEYQVEFNREEIIIGFLEELENILKQDKIV